MRTRLSTLVATASLLFMFMASGACAGQIRINVSGMTFVPLSGTTLNVDDHVVWVWQSTGHSVTSSTSAMSCVGSGLFNSTTLALASSGTAFSWKFDAVGSVPYICLPHCGAGMRGTVNVAASGTAVADFRITEVKYDAASGNDLVEITNLGDADGDLGRYRFVASHDSATVPLDSWTVPAGGRVVVHVGVGGAQDVPSNMFLSNLTDLPSTGSLSLFVPNTAPTGNSLTNATQIIDFVQWGAGGQTGEATAVTANLWSAGNFLPQIAVGHSIEFCGGRDDFGRQYWSEIASPNFGSNGACLTPTLKTTWGRLKTLYR